MAGLSRALPLILVVSCAPTEPEPDAPTPPGFVPAPDSVEGDVIIGGTPHATNGGVRVHQFTPDVEGECYASTWVQVDTTLLAGDFVIPGHSPSGDVVRVNPDQTVASVRAAQTDDWLHMFGGEFEVLVTDTHVEISAAPEVVCTGPTRDETCAPPDSIDATLVWGDVRSELCVRPGFPEAEASLDDGPLPPCMASPGPCDGVPPNQD